jgi:putative phosphoesterase
VEEKMKWLIASDIHGSYYYCEKLLERFKIEKADRLLLLGDVLYHGPRNDLPKDYAPKKVIALLNGMKDSIMCVRGNCDTEVDQMVLDFPVLADYAIITFGERMIYATHGHNYNPEKLPPLKQGDALLYGHIHVPKCYLENGILILNPGSVSIPKENSEHSYMLLEGNELKWKNLDGKEYNSYTL